MDKIAKTIIITGGAQGIGKFTALKLLNSGHNVVVADSDPEAGKELETLANNTNKLLYVQIDVSIETEVIRMINLVLEGFKQIDVLISNAAIGITRKLTELSIEEWNKVIGTNLTGAFLCAKHASTHLKKTNGTIINICSTRALMSEKDTEAYSASKGGLLSLTHALAVSLGPEIRVNAISPGWIDVSQLKKKSAVENITLSEEDHKQHPAGRVGKPDDVTNMILFLMEDHNSFITGQNFIIDGGMTKKMIYV